MRLLIEASPADALHLGSDDILGAILCLVSSVLNTAVIKSYESNYVNCRRAGESEENKKAFCGIQMKPPFSTIAPDSLS